MDDSRWHRLGRWELFVWRLSFGYMLLASIFLPAQDRLLKNLTLATLEHAKEEGI